VIRTLPVFAICIAPTLALAEPCPNNPQALGTARVLEVSAAATPRVGAKQFRTTLDLAPKEVVLTFDDGPWPGTTEKVLAALARECVHATFFLLGRNAASYPALARRELAEGHTVAHHSFAHPLLNRMRPDKAEAEIDRGIAAVELALYQEKRDARASAVAACDLHNAQPLCSPPPASEASGGEGSGVGGSRERGASVVGPRTPFFRFPGFAASPVMLDRLAARGIVVFGADFWASDWNRMSPSHQLRLTLARLEARGGGIVLFHDTKAQTAAMLPAFLRALHARGFRVVHVVPASAKPTDP